MLVTVCDDCGQAFMCDDDASALCAECAPAPDPLRCGECGTTMLVPVATGLCGICDPEWTEHLEVAA